MESVSACSLVRVLVLSLFMAEEERPAIARARIVSVPQAFEDGDIHQWLDKFDLNAKAYKWSVEELFNIVPTYLRGRAFAIFQRIANDRKGT